MKKNVSVLLVIVVALVGIVWWLWPDRHTAPVVASSTPTPAAKPPSASVSSEDLQNTPVEGSPSAVRNRIAQVRAAIKSSNQPIRFYGKVVDQDGADLPGVIVGLSVRQAAETVPGVSTSNTENLTVVTDGSGRFSLSDTRGSLLSVKSLTKEGYASHPDARRYYWYQEREEKKFRPDPSSPEIFRMWKLQGVEPLIHKAMGIEIPYDGTPIQFDIFHGRQVVNGGDLRFQLKRTPLLIERSQTNYEWTATIEATDGGILLSQDEFMYRAPENGYGRSVTIHVPADDPHWSASKRVRFYFKIRGQYGRAVAEFVTNFDRPQTGFGLEVFINPAGSRNLEFDPLQGVGR